MLVVLDTIVIVSGSISPGGAPARIISAWEDRAFELAVSPPLLAEYRRFLGRDRVRQLHRKDDEELDELVSSYARYGTLIEITTAVEGIAPSPADDMVLATAVSIKTDYLVTGDRRFRAIDSHNGVRLVTPNEFLDILKTS